MISNIIVDRDGFVVSTTSTNSIVEKLMDSPQQLRVLAGVILRDGNAIDAVNILNPIKAINYVPYSDFTTIQEIAEFYKVPYSYIDNLLGGLGISSKNFPVDVKKTSAKQIQASLKGKIDEITIEDGVMLFYRKASDECATISFKNPNSLCLYSANIVLAIAPLISPHKTTSDTYYRIIQKLRTTSYFKTAELHCFNSSKARVAEHNKDVRRALGMADIKKPQEPVVHNSDNKPIRVVVDAAKAEESISEEFVSVNPKGKLSVTTQWLFDMAKKIATSVASEFKGANDLDVNDLFREPKNWNLICELYDSKKISEEQASILAGLSVLSFKKYYDEEWKFLEN